MADATGVVPSRSPAAFAPAADPQPAATRRRRESYFEQSRRPLAALALVAPLVVLYELGTWALHLDAGGGRETRIVAFSWIRGGFEALGATGWPVAPAATVALLLGWHLFSRHPWRLRPSVPLAMVAESFLLAVPLLILAVLVATVANRLMPLNAPDADIKDIVGVAVLGIGAGVYEELVFRLMGFALLYALLHNALELSQRATFAVSLVATSVAFSLYHHLPAGGEALAWTPLVFRTLAGLWLGLTFVARGFGLAAGAHAAYDVLLSLTPLLLHGLAATD